MEGYVIIDSDDPRKPDVRELVARHVALGRSLTPGEYAHALDVSDLLAEDVSFFSARARDDGTLLAIGALRELDVAHGEIKSMHTVEEARGHGIGSAMVQHLLDLARTRGYRRVSLETGTSPDFAAAQALYTSAGFEPCGPFGGYAPSPHNLFMTQVFVP